MQLTRSGPPLQSLSIEQDGHTGLRTGSSKAPVGAPVGDASSRRVLHDLRGLEALPARVHQRLQAQG